MIKLLIISTNKTRDAAFYAHPLFFDIYNNKKIILIQKLHLHLK